MLLKWVPGRDYWAMNYLEMSLQQSIVTLRSHGWSFRRIARELGTSSRRIRRVELAGGAVPSPTADGLVTALMFEHSINEQAVVY